jgi:hypothetical protein
MTGHRHTNPNDTSMPASYTWPRSRWSIKFWDTYVKLLARHNVPRPALPNSCSRSVDFQLVGLKAAAAMMAITANSLHLPNSTATNNNALPRLQRPLGPSP